uniref:CCamK n=1 Tax=Arundo donax TaxID=35708 RepID=A0A0A9BU95_ARUDO
MLQLIEKSNKGSCKGSSVFRTIHGKRYPHQPKN